MTAEVQAHPETVRYRLGELLANRRWVRRTRPFPHVYARVVFVPDFYARLDGEFDVL